MPHLQSIIQATHQHHGPGLASQGLTPTSAPRCRRLRDAPLAPEHIGNSRWQSATGRFQAPLVLNPNRLHPAVGEASGATPWGQNQRQKDTKRTLHRLSILKPEAQPTATHSPGAPATLRHSGKAQMRIPVRSKPPSGSPSQRRRHHDNTGAAPASGPAAPARAGTTCLQRQPPRPRDAQEQRRACVAWRPAHRLGSAQPLRAAHRRQLP